MKGRLVCASGKGKVSQVSVTVIFCCEVKLFFRIVILNNFRKIVVFKLFVQYFVFIFVCFIFCSGKGKFLNVFVTLEVYLLV